MVFEIIQILGKYLNNIYIFKIFIE